MEIYYGVAEELIRRGKAYVCTHSQEEIKKFRDQGIPDPCSQLPVEEHMERWEKMLSGEYPEGAPFYVSRQIPRIPTRQYGTG